MVFIGFFEIEVDQVLAGPGHTAGIALKIEEYFGKTHCTAIVKEIGRQYEENDWCGYDQRQLSDGGCVFEFQEVR